MSKVTVSEGGTVFINVLCHSFDCYRNLARIKYQEVGLVEYLIAITKFSFTADIIHSMSCSVTS